MTMRVNPELSTVYCYLGGCTLPKTNIAPENRPGPKRKLVFQPSIFGCKLFVSGMVSSMVFWEDSPLFQDNP